VTDYLLPQIYNNAVLNISKVSEEV